MPPPETKKQLSPRERDILKRWIASGAEYQPHWAFIRPTRAELPAVRDQQWSKNAIDRFVLAKLEAQGLSPAPEADPRTLFRRLHLDITGLPPQPRDMASFLEEYSRDREATLSRWIDHLMATPRLGRAIPHGIGWTRHAMAIRTGCTSITIAKCGLTETG
ncbi:MAG: DUF1549 domain-containing protein [Planctomycetaceae bacterium]